MSPLNINSPVSKIIINQDKPVIIQIGVLGPQGPPGEPGIQGEIGPGTIPGGSTDQILSKATDDDFDAQWIDNFSPLTLREAGALDGVAGLTFILTPVLDDDNLFSYNQMVPANQSFYDAPIVISGLGNGDRQFIMEWISPIDFYLPRYLPDGMHTMQLLCCYSGNEDAIVTFRYHLRDTDPDGNIIGARHHPISDEFQMVRGTERRDIRPNLRDIPMRIYIEDGRRMLLQLEVTIEESTADDIEVDVMCGWNSLATGAMTGSFMRFAGSEDANIWSAIAATDPIYREGAGKTVLDDDDVVPMLPRNGMMGIACDTDTGRTFFCLRTNGSWFSVETA